MLIFIPGACYIDDHAVSIAIHDALKGNMCIRSKSVSQCNARVKRNWARSSNMYVGFDKAGGLFPLPPFFSCNHAMLTQGIVKFLEELAPIASELSEVQIIEQVCRASRGNAQRIALLHIAFQPCSISQGD